MKKKVFTISLLIAFAGILTVSAKTWIVDNSGGSNIADFTSLQEANNSNAVAPGDSVQLIGSGTSYGNINLTKELHVFGTGYRLDENNLTSPNGLYSVTGNLIFNDGSDGSSIEGIKTGDITLNDTSVTITKCHLSKLYLPGSTSANNVALIGSYVGYIYIQPSSGSSVSNVFISNCICYSSYGDKSLTLNGDGSIDNISITNCYFKYNIDMENTTFINNIVDGTFNETGCTVKNNACDEEQLPTTSGNIQNVDFAEVFLGSDSSSFDGQYQSRHDSPIAGLGQLGDDMGPFGGEVPYILSGIPSLPTILHFEAIPVVTDELEFKIKVKSFL